MKNQFFIEDKGKIIGVFLTRKDADWALQPGQKVIEDRNYRLDGVELVNGKIKYKIVEKEV